MTEKTLSVTRRRRMRVLVVSLLGVGAAAWAVRRRFDERLGLDEGWHALPPAPQPAPPVPARPVPVPAVVSVAPAALVPAVPERAVPERAAPRAVAAATAVASVATPARPGVPGAVRSLADGSSPDPGYAVKGKVATKVFHAPGGAYYTRTRADVWFRCADDARAAGFTERVRRHH